MHPWQYLVLIVHCPIQFIELTICIIGLKTLTILVNQVTRKRTISFFYIRQCPRQTACQLVTFAIRFLTIYRQTIGIQMRYLILVIHKLRTPIATTIRRKQIIQLIHYLIRLHGQFAIQLHLIEISIIHTGCTFAVEIYNTSLTHISIQVLIVLLAVGSNTISCLQFACPTHKRTSCQVVSRHIALRSRLVK